MNEEFYAITKARLNSDFANLLNSFSLKFGGFEKGIEKLADYIGFSYLVDKDEVRGYGGVPFEMVLPFATGSDGEHMGWMNISPNDPNFDMPFVVWAPMGGYVFYIGTKATEIVANQVRYLHEEDEYKSIDLDFLNSININPKGGKQNQLLISFEKSLPLKLSNGLKHEMTFDGTGVLANESLFNSSFKREELPNVSSELNRAKQNLKLFPATALVIAKDVYFEIWHEGNSNEFYQPTLELLQTCYELLHMETAKLLMQKENEG